MGRKAIGKAKAKGKMEKGKMENQTEAGNEHLHLLVVVKRDDAGLLPIGEASCGCIRHPASEGGDSKDLLQEEVRPNYGGKRWPGSHFDYQILYYTGICSEQP